MNNLQLDKLIAEKVMKLKVVHTTWGKKKQYGEYSIGEPSYDDYSGEMILSNPLPAYSSDMSTAWEMINETFGLNKISIIFNHEHTDAVTCELITADGETFTASGEDVPTAICLVALKAVPEDIL